MMVASALGSETRSGAADGAAGSHSATAVAPSAAVPVRQMTVRSAGRAARCGAIGRHCARLSASSRRAPELVSTWSSPSRLSVV